MPNIRVTCPACKSELEIDAAFAGQEVECGNCLEVFIAKDPKTSGAGKSGTGKIPGAGSSRAGSSGAGGGRSKSEDRPAKKKRRDDDDDDYDHDRRRRDDDDDDDDYAPPPPRRSGGGSGDGLATASMVMGITSIVLVCCCWPVSIPVGLCAAITGAIGIKSQNNKGMAVAGLVMGIISLCLTGVVITAGLGNAIINPNQFR